MTETEVNVKISPQVKEEADELFGKFGLTTEEAIDIFLHTAVKQRKFPFIINLPEYDKSGLKIEKEEEKNTKYTMEAVIEEYKKSLFHKY